MNNEQAQVVVRNRQGFEALDLGLVMARAWYAPLLKAAAAMVIPLFMILSLVSASEPGVAVMVIWWLKPVWERPLVVMAGRRFFGDQISVLESIRAAGIPTLRQLVELLVLFRLSPLRSYFMPIDVLEGLGPSDRRSRKSLLSGSQTGTASLFFLLCLHAESLLYLCVFPFAWNLLPEGVQLDPGQIFLNLHSGELEVWTLVMGALSVTAMLVMMPFYVLGGFALYINRRVVLEAWDIDLAFTRMRHRFSGVGPGLLMAVLLLGSFPMVSEAQASQPSREEIRYAAREVMEAEEFGGEVTTYALRPTFDLNWDWLDFNDEEPAVELPRLNLGFALRLVVGALGAWALAMLVMALWKAGRNAADTGAEHVAPPEEVVFGLDLRKSSLPPDIVGAAKLAWSENDTRSALSFLYRGLLHLVVYREHVRIPKSATEGECVFLVKDKLAADFAEDFRVLTGHWTRAAYGKKMPSPPEFQSLLERLAPHFVAPDDRVSSSEQSP